MDTSFHGIVDFERRLAMANLTGLSFIVADIIFFARLTSYTVSSRVSDQCTFVHF